MSPNQLISGKPTSPRREQRRATQNREHLRDALIVAAERTMERHGLQGLRARALAEEVGCAVGAIYNVVEDLDDLILAVNARTLAALETQLAAAVGAGSDLPPGPDARKQDRAVSSLVRLALAYLDFASTNMLRWRALFDHRLPEGRPLPDWYKQDQQRLFDYVEEQLRDLQPDVSRERRALLARSLFSAVHGIVVLGLEERLQAIPLGALSEQLTFIVSTLGRGMTTAA